MATKVVDTNGWRKYASSEILWKSYAPEVPYEKRRDVFVERKGSGEDKYTHMIFHFAD